MCRAVIGAILVSAVLSAEGVQPTRPTAPKEMAAAFLTALGKGEIAPAYGRLLVGSPLSAQPLQLDALRRQTEAVLPVYGKVLGFELYKEDKFGEYLVRLVYIQRLEKHPLVWKFWFYRPAGEWQVNAVVFNDQFLVE